MHANSQTTTRNLADSFCSGIWPRLCSAIIRVSDYSVDLELRYDPWHDWTMLRLLLILIQLSADAVRWFGLMLRPQRSIEAENLFLRRQLALYVERDVEPRRIDSVTRVALAFLSRFFHWRDALVVVCPETMIRWHRAGWKLLWRLKSRPGRPSIPVEVQVLIRRMANENPSWGEERIANELC
jgi:putative transposase